MYLGCMVKEEILPLLRMALCRTERLVYLGCMVKEKMLVPLWRMVLWRTERTMTEIRSSSKEEKI